LGCATKGQQCVVKSPTPDMTCCSGLSCNPNALPFPICWAAAPTPAPAPVPAPTPAPAPTPNCTVLPNLSIALPDLKFYPGPFPPNLCCDLCSSFPGCGAFTANASGCALKSSTTKLEPSAGSTSGINPNPLPAKPTPAPAPKPTPSPPGPCLPGPETNCNSCPNHTHFCHEYNGTSKCYNMCHPGGERCCAGFTCHRFGSHIYEGGCANLASNLVHD
jgi:hypothetical protein